MYYCLFQFTVSSYECTIIIIFKIAQVLFKFVQVCHFLLSRWQTMKTWIWEDKNIIMATTCLFSTLRIWSLFVTTIFPSFLSNFFQRFFFEIYVLLKGILNTTKIRADFSFRDKKWQKRFDSTSAYLLLRRYKCSKWETKTLDQHPK